jgi:hypothetical protein
MSNIQNAIADFMMALDASNMRGADLLEITVSEALFMDLMSELPESMISKQGDLFTGFQKLPEWVKVCMPFGYVKVNRGVAE